jgi:hypothetical protein
MSKNFTFSLSGVNCKGESFNEPGKDEIMIVGFAMTDHGE